MSDKTITVKLTEGQIEALRSLVSHSNSDSTMAIVKVLNAALNNARKVGA